jgi:hypothetical protein
VRAVAGLAPWIEPGDPVEPVTGRHVLVAHGDHDRITSARGSAAWARQAGRVAASAGYVSVRGERHAMVRRAALWHALTTGYVLAVLCGLPPTETEPSPAAKVIERVLAGNASVVV